MDMNLYCCRLLTDSDSFSALYHSCGVRECVRTYSMWNNALITRQPFIGIRNAVIPLTILHHTYEYTYTCFVELQL